MQQTIVRTERERPIIAGRFGPVRGDVRSPAFQAFLLLWIAFTVAPILFGIDKFFNRMTFWPQYLWAGFPHFFGHVSSLHFMYAVGVVEIIAGIVVAISPRIGGLVVAAWLAGIIVDLLLVGGYGDIALRDFGLLVAAVALSRLASAARTPGAGLE